MSPLRLLMLLVSFAAHAAFVVPLVINDTGEQVALEAGTGNDQLNLEQSIKLEGIASLGTALETVQAVDAPPPQPIAPTPTEAVEAIEPEPEFQDVITANAEPVEESVLPEEIPEEVEEVEEKVEELQPVQAVAIEEQVAKGASKSGGDPTLKRKYLGKLRRHLDRKKINPRTRRSGTAVVRFTVDPEGNILSREVTKSSGYPKLDRAAIKSIDRAAPFPPFPNGVAGETLVVSVPFRFSIR